MPIELLVTLVTGDKRRINVDEDDAAAVAKRLRMNAAPFSAEWIEADDGELIRVSAIATVRIAPSDDGTAPAIL